MAKKKSTHSEKSTEQQNQKMEPENQNTTAPPMEDPSEKVSSLKSLNAMLLKETVEKRQEVSALLESKKSLESQLTRSVSEIEAMKAELTQWKDGKMETELGMGVVSAFVESQIASEVDLLKRDKEELERVNEGLRREKTMVETRLKDLEREMGVVVRERNEFEKVKFQSDLEIGSMKKLENELRNEIKREQEALNSVISENESIKKDFVAQVEETNKLREKLDEMESKERNATEELGDLKSKYQVTVMNLEESENRIDSIRMELGFVVKNCNELKSEFESLNGEMESIMREKEELSRERSEQDSRISELEKEACQLNAIISSLREDEEKWRLKFFELEKSNAEIVEKLEELERGLNALLEEKKEKETEIEGLLGEKSRVLKSLNELEKELENARQVKEEIVEEKNRLEQVKSSQENEITELHNELLELQNNLSSLQESTRNHIEKNKELLAEIDNHKYSIARVTVERDDFKTILEEEKKNGMKLQVKVSEISKKMEETAKVIEELKSTSDTIVGEKKELENNYIKLVEEKGITENKFAEAQKKISELEVLISSKSDMFESAMTMLKNTALQLSKGENEGITSNDRSFNGDLEPYLGEIEAIRLAFRRREEKVGEMEQEMELLQCSVIEARKKKSFWTLVSSATTLLAAVVSFAYAAKAR